LNSSTRGPDLTVRDFTHDLAVEVEHQGPKWALVRSTKEPLDTLAKAGFEGRCRYFDRFQKAFCLLVAFPQCRVTDSPRECFRDASVVYPLFKPLPEFADAAAGSPFRKDSNASLVDQPDGTLAVTSTDGFKKALPYYLDDNLCRAAEGAIRILVSEANVILIAKRDAKSSFDAATASYKASAEKRKRWCSKAAKGQTVFTIQGKLEDTLPNGSILMNLYGLRTTKMTDPVCVSGPFSVDGIMPSMIAG